MPAPPPRLDFPMTPEQLERSMTPVVSPKFQYLDKTDLTKFNNFIRSLDKPTQTGKGGAKKGKKSKKSKTVKKTTKSKKRKTRK